MGSFLAAITAFVELLPVFKKLISLYSEARTKGWVKDGNQLQQKIQTASTEQERMDLAQYIFYHRPK